MMIKTPNVWDPVIHSALTNGALRLQPGQWVRCGADNDHAAIWVGINPRSKVMYVAHWKGSRAATLRQYHNLKAAVAGSIA